MIFPYASACSVVALCRRPPVGTSATLILASAIEISCRLLYALKPRIIGFKNGPLVINDIEFLDQGKLKLVNIVFGR